MGKTPKINLAGAAIVCAHVALERLPILLAERSEPDEPLDTGWQFLCNSGADEPTAGAQIWALGEVLMVEPSLSEFVNLPPGTQLTRKSADSPWIVSKHES